MQFLQAFLRRSLEIVVAVTLLSCANQLPPDGGPIDTVPPTIISTYPAPYTVHFDDTKIVLEFDKYVDHRSVEESIFISPYVGSVEYNWSGREVEITFSEKVRRNRTYVVNVGTDVVDLRNRNRMAQAFTLAFSSGDDIDHGAIRGRMFPLKSGDPVEGVMIFAYNLSGVNPDTLNPHTVPPDYITQSGKNGEFSLMHLAFGSYRLFAVKDEYRNLLYDPEVDEYGVLATEVRLTPEDTLQPNLTMRLAREDTTAPRLTKAEAHDVHHVVLEFSEAIDTTGASSVQIRIIDTLSNSRLSSSSLFPNLPKLSSFTVVTDQQDSVAGYAVTILAAQDLVGNPINANANSLMFQGASKVDSAAPRISSISIPDSSRGIVLLPAIQIRFSDAVRKNTLTNAVTLKDSLGRTIRTSIVWLHQAVMSVKPLDKLSGKSWHKLSVLTYGAEDWSGRKFRDSLRVIRFETLDAESFSAIEGTVMDRNSNDLKGSVIVTVESAEPKESRTQSTVAASNGSFILPEVFEGRYVLRGYRDRNSNGVYDPGKPFPFVPSERFNVVQDTLKVRARWPLEGLKLELK